MVNEDLVGHHLGCKVRNRMSVFGSTVQGRRAFVKYIASKEGYLIKRGAIHKNWKKRWFVLQKHLLKYYSDKLSPTPIRSVDLNEATHVIEDFCDNKKNCFRLGLPNRIFYFVANSPHEAKAWIEILQWKIDYYKDRQRDQSDGAVHTSLSSAGNVGEHAAYIAQYTKV